MYKDAIAFERAQAGASPKKIAQFWNYIPLSAEAGKLFSGRNSAQATRADFRYVGTTSKNGASDIFMGSPNIL